jgi:uncharacterized protein YbjT (DUF2867 family)
MKILILGSTGRTGRVLVTEALKRGYHVNVLVRNKNRLPFPAKSVTVFEGSPVNAADLKIALRGCKAVISALNISRTSDFPWAKLISPPHLLSDTMSTLIPIAKQQNIFRIITVSAWGVLETSSELPFWLKWVIRYSNVAAAYHQHEAQEELLRSSGLNWTAVRPTILFNSGKQEDIKVSYNGSPKPGLFISRYSLAQFALRILQDNIYYKKSPTVSEE